MSRQKHPSPDLEDRVCSSLNLCCVLQCSALLPWQKSPHSNNLFQRRLKRDSAHAQKCCTCSVSSLQRPFQRDPHKDRREIRYCYFLPLLQGVTFVFQEAHAQICLPLAQQGKTTLEACQDSSLQIANSHGITKRQ